MRALIVLLLFATSAWGQATTTTAPAAGYQERLYRLSEILGGLHSVRSICETNDSHWRDRMQELIRLERPSTDERNGMVEHFNLGYAQANGKFTSCSDGARAYAATLAREGQDISRSLGQTVGEATTH